MPPDAFTKVDAALTVWSKEVYRLCDRIVGLEVVFEPLSDAQIALAKLVAWFAYVTSVRVRIGLIGVVIAKQVAGPSLHWQRLVGQKLSSDSDVRRATFRLSWEQTDALLAVDDWDLAQFLHRSKNLTSRVRALEAIIDDVIGFTRSAIYAQRSLIDSSIQVLRTGVE